MDKVKKILKLIPGFRSGTNWKMVIASLYYVFAIITIAGGFGMFLLVLSVPFIIIGIWDLLKHNKKQSAGLMGLGFIFLIIAFFLIPSSESSTPTATATPVPTIEVTATPMPTSTVAPTIEPTAEPTSEPTAEPTSAPTAEPVQESNSVAESSSSESTQMVWVGNTGTKYHRQGCRTLKGGGHQITLSEALAEGREACAVCH